MKLSCRLAHSAIAGSSRNGGAEPASRAANNAPEHSTSKGIASICGRASRWASTMAAASATAIRAENGSAQRSRNRVSSPRLAAKQAIVSKTSPLHPAAR